MYLIASLIRNNSLDSDWSARMCRLVRVFTGFSCVAWFVSVNYNLCKRTLNMSNHSWSKLDLIYQYIYIVLHGSTFSLYGISHVCV